MEGDGCTPALRKTEMSALIHSKIYTILIFFLALKLVTQKQVVGGLLGGLDCLICVLISFFGFVS